jgi:hypothetical protein
MGPLKVISVPQTVVAACPQPRPGGFQCDARLTLHRCNDYRNEKLLAFPK